MKRYYVIDHNEGSTHDYLSLDDAREGAEDIIAEYRSDSLTNEEWGLENSDIVIAVVVEACKYNETTSDFAMKPLVEKLLGAWSPGPWRLIPQEEERAHVICDVFGDCIGLLPVETGDNLPNEQAANARLMTAAPDLVAALQAIASTGDDAGQNGTAEEVRHALGSMISVARAALAQVAGHEQ